MHINHILGGTSNASDQVMLVSSLYSPDRVLPTFSPKLTEKVEKKLKEQGIEIIKGVHVKEIDEDGVQVGDEYIQTNNAFWLAGVAASPAGKWLGAEVDRGGRVKVQSDLSVPGHPNIFVIGDTACVLQDGKPLPGVAQPAIQGGHYVAKVIADKVAGREHKEPFKYFDKGSMAVVGRTYAVVESLADSHGWLHGLHDVGVPPHLLPHWLSQSFHRSPELLLFLLVLLAPGRDKNYYAWKATSILISREGTHTR